MKGRFLVLDADVLNAMMDNYVFSIMDSRNILVSTKNYPNRQTLHKRDVGWQALYRNGDVNITFKITPLAMDLWYRHSDRYNLIWLQNEINRQKKSIVDFNEEDFKKLLED